MQREPLRKVSRLTNGAVMALLLSVSAPNVFAQIEEVLVTAQKREQSAQEVGLTITAFDEDTYRELTRGTLEGLTSQLSNAQAYATNTFIQSVHLRGIGLNEFQGQYDSPVAQHIDEVYVSKPWMVARRHYDIQRVEVLKGPQGTLFGRNTTGGAVNFYTQPPSRRIGGRIEIGVDEHERYRAEGMVTGPLTDRLSARLSFLTELGSGGPQQNLFTGDEHGEPGLYDMRGQLLWQGENLAVRALVHGGKDSGDRVAFKGPGIYNLSAPGFCPELFTGEVSTNPSHCPKFAGFAALAGSPAGEFEPEDIFTINQNTPPEVDDTFYGGYLRFDHDAGWANLTSITAYEYYERIQREDSQSDIFDATSTNYYNQIKQVSQELRLAFSPTDVRRYLLGFYYQYDDLKQVDGSDLSEQPLPGVTPPFADQLFAQFEMDLESVAVFAHHEYDLSDTLTFSAGLRYTSDQTQVSDALLGIGNLPQVGKEKFVTPCLITTYPQGPVGSPACPFLGPTAPLFSDSRRDTDISWRAGINWAPKSNLLIYGNLTTGYRSGGYSLPLGGPATQFEPEDLFAQEVGLKSQWLDSSLQINASVFHYLYDEVQVNVDDPVSPIVPITRNIGEQKNFGAEVELEWVPDERWFLRQIIGWLHARYRDTDRVVSTYAGAIPLDGKTPVNSPEWTYSGMVRYRQPITTTLDDSISLDYRWIDDRFLEATNQAFDAASAYWVVNLRAALTAQDDRWEMALYGTNLFDEEYLTYINNIGFFKLDIFGEPRTFGATVSYRFD